MKEKYFLYDPENGFETFETNKKCLEEANNSIQHYLHDGWDENVENVVIGIITHSAMKTNVEHKPNNPEEAEDINCSNEFAYTCDYEMLPSNLPPEEPKKGEWWMCQSKDTLRKCPMVKTASGWGSITNPDDKPIADYIQTQPIIAPLFKMVSA